MDKIKEESEVDYCLCEVKLIEDLHWVIKRHVIEIEEDIALDTDEPKLFGYKVDLSRVVSKEELMNPKWNRIQNILTKQLENNITLERFNKSINKETKQYNYTKELLDNVIIRFKMWGFDGYHFIELVLIVTSEDKSIKKHTFLTLEKKI